MYTYIHTYIYTRRPQRLFSRFPLQEKRGNGPGGGREPYTRGGRGGKVQALWLLAYGWGWGSIAFRTTLYKRAGMLLLLLRAVFTCCSPAFGERNLGGFLCTPPFVTPSCLIFDKTSIFDFTPHVQAVPRSCRLFLDNTARRTHTHDPSSQVPLQTQFPTLVTYCILSPFWSSALTPGPPCISTQDFWICTQFC